jgi:hypothetical protein
VPPLADAATNSDEAGDPEAEEDALAYDVAVSMQGVVSGFRRGQWPGQRIVVAVGTNVRLRPRAWVAAVSANRRHLTRHRERTVRG